MTFYRFACIILILCLPGLRLAGQDTVIFHNDNIITGEVESMDKGVFVFSTDYSDSDFKIEWDQIRDLYTHTYFMVTLTDGTEYVARLRTTGQDSVNLYTRDGLYDGVKINDVVYLEAMEDRFINRFSAMLDVGFTYTKSQNIQRFNVRGSLGYSGRKWHTDINWNSIWSSQDGIEPTFISNETWNIRYSLIPNLFVLFTLELLEDTEQQLDMRANSQAGLGTFIFRSNKAFWGAKTGINRNMERYHNEADDRDSWEGFVGTELNIFDVGDLDFLIRGILYPGITEKGRWRSDINLDIKYEFPLDIYIRGGMTLNWDNMPVEGSEPVNLMLQAGIGWEW
jgi:hypothetical protein